MAKKNDDSKKPEMAKTKNADEKGNPKEVVVIKVAEEKELIDETNKIFRTLMHFPGSSFSDLWDKQVESNKFNYYLKKMETEGLVEKREGKYYLTVKGKKASTTISGETGKEEKRPAVTLLLVIRRMVQSSKGKKSPATSEYVLYKRMKEPYYGHCGFPGAKMKRGEEILEAAERELMEETGLDGRGKGKIISVQNGHVINDGDLFHHMLQFVVLFDNPPGELVKDNREGTYEWAPIGEILAQKNLFPDIPGVIQAAEEGSFCIKEIKFLQENEKFVGLKEKKVYK